MILYALEEKPKYLFSIVMAIYNVEEYLEEAIDSVLNQWLDFERHVQLILVNDGSEDNSESICLKYKDLYPDNIVYIRKENGGAASARNAGLKYARGKYINFLDPDDKLSRNTLHVVYNFFEKHYSEVDIVSIPLIFFEARKGQHTLNNKFQRKSRVIDILEEFDKIQLSAASTFIKREAINNRMFNENLKYAEDAELLNRIILDKCKLGVVHNVKYYYRQRQSKTSAVQTGELRKEWYNDYIENFSMSIINYAKEQLGYVPKYIQYLVMYDLQWRFNVERPDRILEKDELDRFLNNLKRVLQEIDDEIIMMQRSLNMHRKVFALKMKRDKLDDAGTKIFLGDNALLYFDNILVDELNKQSVLLTSIAIENNKLYIEGEFGSLFNKDDVNLIVEMNGQEYETKYNEWKFHNIYSLGFLIKEYYGFKAELPIGEQKLQNVKFLANVNDKKIPLTINLTKFTKVNQTFKRSYYYKDGYILKHNKRFLTLEKSSFLKRVNSEIKLLKEIWSSNRIGARKAVAARCIVFLLNLFKRKELWLIMDKQNKADDNAEHFFKYAVKQKDGIKKVFVINKDSADFNRIREIGTVVPYGTYKHKILLLLADKLISSHAEDQIFNPFLSLDYFYKDLMDFDYVFLQHGIIKDDLSKFLNCYNKNFKMFVTSAKPEYKSIVNGGYGFDGSVVKLTGLPRFDNLQNKDKKQILIMPTWRMSIVKEKDRRTGVRPYNPYFKQSSFFQNYNALINDQKIIDFAKKKGFKLIFYPHPEIIQQIDDFERNDYTIFQSANESYQKLINESSMIITDYSSIAFDFAYLRKPVLYYHFDEYHYDEGYFDYETMGFGEVCKEYDELIDTIIEYIENDCKMKQKYIDRVNHFYAYTDRNNCKRVYEEVKKL